MLQAASIKSLHEVAAGEALSDCRLLLAVLSHVVILNLALNAFCLAGLCNANFIQRQTLNRFRATRLIVKRPVLAGVTRLQSGNFKAVFVS